MEYEDLGVVKNLRKTNLSSNLWWLRQNILRIISEREATAEKFNLSNYEKALTEVNNKLLEKDEAFIK